jgi:hypothetical protein
MTSAKRQRRARSGFGLHRDDHLGPEVRFLGHPDRHQPERRPRIPPGAWAALCAWRKLRARGVEFRELTQLREHGLRMPEGAVVYWLDWLVENGHIVAP